MSTWQITKQRIKLFPHPSADKLELGKVGTYQVVVQKGLYSDGDCVIFVPEKSVLTGVLHQEFYNYLAGSNKDRVKAVSLRGELSCGVVLSNDLVIKATGERLANLPEGVDLSQRMGITKYEPPIPTQLAGQVERIPDDVRYGQHDCEQFGVYADQFVSGEQVVVTEKIHGSQAIFYWDTDKDLQFVTSKGLLSKGLCIAKSDQNAYWRAIPPIKALVQDMLKANYPDQRPVVQVFGELIPCQGANWTYGYKQPAILVFDLQINGKSVPYQNLKSIWGSVWVPVLYQGSFNPNAIRTFRQGTEQISGKELHIREGAVVRPVIDRYASDGTRLVLKLINPAYKETGEEIN